VNSPNIGRNFVRLDFRINAEASANHQNATSYRHNVAKGTLATKSSLECRTNLTIIIIQSIIKNQSSSADSYHLEERYFPHIFNRDCSVGTATGYWLDGRGSTPGRCTSSRPALLLTQSPIQCLLEALSPGVKRSGYEADHSVPSSAEVKHGGSTPPFYHASSRCGA
jgi:hypothetical protein